MTVAIALATLVLVLALQMFAPSSVAELVGLTWAVTICIAAVANEQWGYAVLNGLCAIAWVYFLWKWWRRKGKRAMRELGYKARARLAKISKPMPVRPAFEG